MQEIDASISEGVLSFSFDFFVELGTPKNDIALNAFTHNAVIQLSSTISSQVIHKMGNYRFTLQWTSRMEVRTVFTKLAERLESTE